MLRRALQLCLLIFDAPVQFGHRNKGHNKFYRQKARQTHKHSLTSN